MDPNTAATLGQRFRDARERQGLSLRQMARRCGISAPYLSDIENDRRIPAEAVLIELARACGMDVNEAMALAGRFGAVAEQYMKDHVDFAPVDGRLEIRFDCMVESPALNAKVSEIIGTPSKLTPSQKNGDEWYWTLEADGP